MLCDYGSTERDGKLNLVGVFQQFESEVIPFEPRRFYIVIFLELEESDYSAPFSITLKLLDPVGAATDIRQEMNNVTMPKPPEGKTRMNLFLEVTGLKFNKSGKYNLHVECNGKRVDRVPVPVKQTVIEVAVKNNP